MIGLAFLLALVVYLAVSFLVARWVARWARGRGWRGRFVAVLTFVVMLGLVFWDWIPVHAVHRYYCFTQSGFTVYKTLEQWQLENPRVSENLTIIEDSRWDKIGNLTRVKMNERFFWEFEYIMHPLKIRERNDRILDAKTGEILARKIDFNTGIKNISIGTDELRDYKFWLKADFCPRSDAKSKWLVDGESFSSFREKIANVNGVIR